MNILPVLRPELGVPLLIVQHNLKGMSQMMASSLNQTTSIRVEEARGGEQLLSGRAAVYLAPAGCHTRIIYSRDDVPIIIVRENKRMSNLLPSVDETMSSAAQVFGSHLLGVILTGMGNDGTKGLGMIKKAGGITMAQEPRTCAVASMPLSAIQSGVVDHIVPLQHIGTRINMLVLSSGGCS
jgi:two-component system chemotaxis response regulator CheB